MKKSKGTLKWTYLVLKKLAYTEEYLDIRFPTSPFIVLELQNPSCDVSGQHKICRSPDFEAHKL